MALEALGTDAREVLLDHVGAVIVLKESIGFAFWIFS